MQICVTGSTGLVGAEFTKSTRNLGHEIIPLVRRKPASSGGVYWNPSANEIDSQSLVGADAVVHLAGEGIASGRWSAAKKDRIRSSRVTGTRLIAESLAKLDGGPRKLVCASAIGYYGDRGDELLSDESSSGDGFLASVCREWEAACQPAVEAGIRTVNSRFGIILSKHGGALQKMLLPFRLGGGGIVGDGRQYWSWIAIDDVIGAIQHALASDDLNGPVNFVAPNSVTNQTFTKTLGKVLRRPTIVPMPAFAARLVLGEMADELLLASTRVEPTKLTSSGYAYKYPELEAALRHVLK